MAEPPLRRALVKYPDGFLPARIPPALRAPPAPVLEALRLDVDDAGAEVHVAALEGQRLRPPQAGEAAQRGYRPQLGVAGLEELRVG